MTPIVPTRWTSSGPGSSISRSLQHRQPDRLAFAQRFLDQLDAGLLDDRERNDGVREEHRLLKRQNADQVGGNDALIRLCGPCV